MTSRNLRAAPLKNLEMPKTASPHERKRPTAHVVLPLPAVRDDEALVLGLRSGETWARATFFDRYAPEVERILRRIVGPDAHTDLADLVHDAFVQALGSLSHLRDPAALRGWMQSIAAHTAYHAIRARRVRRWLHFWEPEQIPEVAFDDVDPQVREAYRRTYLALDRLPADERVAFVLRYVEGLELVEVAEACSVSLSTIKRRISRAETRFARAAERDEVLSTWLKEGGRWTT